jgi:outer membrane lipoprotein-sorting protein
MVLVIAALSANSENYGSPADTSYTPVKDTITLKKKISGSSEINKTIESNFIQEKHMSIFTEPVTSKGRFSYKNKTMVRWEYTEPFEYVVVINNGKLSVRDNSKVNSYDMTANSAFLEINGKLNAIIKGDIVNDNKDFRIRYFENNSLYLLKLKPLSKDMKNFFKEIEICFDKKDISVSIIKMVELSGDFTEIKFIGKKINVEISDDKFNLK